MFRVSNFQMLSSGGGEMGGLDMKIATVSSLSRSKLSLSSFELISTTFPVWSVSTRRNPPSGITRLSPPVSIANCVGYSMRSFAVVGISVLSRSFTTTLLSAVETCVSSGSIRVTKTMPLSWKALSSSMLFSSNGVFTLSAFRVTKCHIPSLIIVRTPLVCVLYPGTARFTSVPGGTNTRFVNVISSTFPVLWQLRSCVRSPALHASVSSSHSASIAAVSIWSVVYTAICSFAAFSSVQAVNPKGHMDPTGAVASHVMVTGGSGRGGDSPAGGGIDSSGSYSSSPWMRGPK